MRSAARRERRPARSKCARVATDARAASPTTTSTASRLWTPIDWRSSTTNSTGTTGRCATRSTTGARSCKAGCTRRASRVRTVTSRTRSSSCPRATPSAPDAIFRRSSTPPQHTHHAEGTPGAACAACHMPTTTYMVVDPRHDHSMRIPRPDVAVKVGAPNACNNCHARQTAQWAADAIARWTGKPPASYQNFGAALRAGSLAAPGARGALLALIEDKSNPALVRASAIARLGRLLTPVTIDATARELNDPDSLVRLAAVEALANAEPATRQRYLPRMLADPVRSVRIEAARALAGQSRVAAGGGRARGVRAVACGVCGGADLQRRPLREPDQPRQPVRAARRRVRRDRGVSQGDRASIRHSSPAYANLADLYRARGADGEAAAVLREGLARNPRAAVLYSRARARARSSEADCRKPESRCARRRSSHRRAPASRTSTRWR